MKRGFICYSTSNQPQGFYYKLCLITEIKTTIIHEKQKSQLKNFGQWVDWVMYLGRCLSFQGDFISRQIK